MNRIRFEWDEKKNRENQRKHGVSFEEAETVFYDENAIQYFDPITRKMRIGSLCWA